MCNVYRGFMKHEKKATKPLLFSLNTYYPFSELFLKWFPSKENQTLFILAVKCPSKFIVI